MSFNQMLTTDKHKHLAVKATCAVGLIKATDKVGTTAIRTLLAKNSIGKQHIALPYGVSAKILSRFISLIEPSFTDGH
jgi:hypothetical protein